ncbi:hypothetical protein MMC18_005561 [Xylographa bjoerkii]|nr:hypothetical protein [Xylographa bjoerkii]
MYQVTQSLTQRAFSKAIILAFLSLTTFAAARALYGVYERDANPYYDDEGLYAWEAAPYYDTDDVYARDTEPEAYYEDEGIYARYAAPDPVPTTENCKRGMVLAPRGCIPSSTVGPPSHCHDMFLMNQPGHVPAQSRIDCYNRIQCKGATKKNVGLSPLLEKSQ